MSARQTLTSVTIAAALAIGAAPSVAAVAAKRRPPVPPRAGVWEASLPLGYVRFELQRARTARIVGLERFHTCKGRTVDVRGRESPRVSKLRRFASASTGMRGRFLTGGTAVVELTDPCSRQRIQVLAHRVGLRARVLRGVYVGADAAESPVRVRIWDASDVAAGAGVDCGRGQRLCRVEVTLGAAACAPGLAPLARRLPIGPVGAAGTIRLVGQGIAGAAPTILVARVQESVVRGTVTVAGPCGEYLVPFEAALTLTGQIAGAASPPTL